MALGLPSLLRTFGNSADCSKLSFDSDCLINEKSVNRYLLENTVLLCNFKFIFLNFD